MKNKHAKVLSVFNYTQLQSRIINKIFIFLTIYLCFQKFSGYVSGINDYFSIYDYFYRKIMCKL